MLRDQLADELDIRRGDLAASKLKHGARLFLHRERKSYKTTKRNASGALTHCYRNLTNDWKSIRNRGLETQRNRQTRDDSPNRRTHQKPAPLLLHGASL